MLLRWSLQPELNRVDPGVECVSLNQAMAIRGRSGGVTPADPLKCQVERLVLSRQSPIEGLLATLDGLDGQAVAGLFAPGGRRLVADGRRSTGTAAIIGLLSDCLAKLRSSKHNITAQWNPERSVWLAEGDADYELRDWLQLSGLPCVFVVRLGPDGIEGLRVYDAQDQELFDRCRRLQSRRSLHASALAWKHRSA
jgi:hypothetical protein